MNAAPQLRTALLVDGIYAIVVGIALLFPAWASAIFAYPTKDPAVTSGWGGSIIGIGLIALAASSDAAKYSGIAWTLVVGLLLTAIDLLYFWTTGAYTARNVAAPVIINIALAAWIWFARPKA